MLEISYFNMPLVSAPKQQRPCNGIAWNHTESNLVSKAFFMISMTRVLTYISRDPIQAHLLPPTI